MVTRVSSRAFQIATDLVLVVAAVALVGWVILRDSGRLPNSRVTIAPKRVADAGWADARRLGTEIGDSSGSLRVVEFLDLECPACAAYHLTTMQEVLQRRAFPSVSGVVVHFPLRSHRNARYAARAAECARLQGRFREFVGVALERQAALGGQDWIGLAGAAGVADTISFTRCVGDDNAFVRVDSGRALGDRIGVSATPTIIVNGWHFSVPPTTQQILDVAHRKPSER